jgi:SHS2 domain-containing protein
MDSIAKHIKAVTFHDLRIVATQEGLEVTIVFDV